MTFRLEDALARGAHQGAGIAHQRVDRDREIAHEGIETDHEHEHAHD